MLDKKSKQLKSSLTCIFQICDVHSDGLTRMLSILKSQEKLINQNFWMMIRPLLSTTKK